MSEPLFTADDVHRLRDIMETEHFDRQFQEYAVFMMSIADRIERYLDDQAVADTEAARKRFIEAEVNKAFYGAQAAWLASRPPTPDITP